MHVSAPFGHNTSCVLIEGMILTLTLIKRMASQFFDALAHVHEIQHLKDQIIGLPLRAIAGIGLYK